MDLEGFNAEVARSGYLVEVAFDCENTLVFRVPLL